VGATNTLPRGWDARRIGDLTGRRYLITGGTSGLGLETARALSAHGGHVTITARNATKAASVIDSSAASDVLEMDLMDLGSVRAAALKVEVPYDVVILNAGVMWTPFTLSADGFESQMATNHLGHFALVGLIKEFITDRVVAVSSIYHRYGTFGDRSSVQIERRCRGLAPYSPKFAYGDSKLANLLFVQEIERRRAREGWKFIALAAHPGWSNTHLFDTAASSRGTAGAMTSLSSHVFAQSAARGALPQLCAATFPGLLGGEYLGPRGPGQLRGTPKFVGASPTARDAVLARDVWKISEELTGVIWS
jgi:NAD(P)-dependent dehydrogenase (short-subunit alcohol dehydrogenase family)